ncbi:protein NIM1-INTERACTING 1-like [Vigna radiata var. radiata]|uniref:Protein NIM1-INTERACTING 1-like n=1 Tax=Vigna radiata var. radiata TaxID=3916 RepID=A0A1S3V4P4_VIGRR|nr:protein NIM1-INTERACTING 1-like [Vigna radiata var. radiata]
MENKKREARNDEDRDDENDEMKMEKFYSLLRSFRDARDRRRRELMELEKNESNRKKMKTTTTTSTTAKPEVAFEFQDFTTDIHFRKPPLVFPNPSSRAASKDIISNGKKNAEQHDVALDLKLAL